MIYIYIKLPRDRISNRIYNLPIEEERETKIRVASHRTLESQRFVAFIIFRGGPKRSPHPAESSRVLAQSSFESSKSVVRVVCCIL